jgi:hypothetical protein
VRLNPDDPLAHYQLAVALITLGEWGEGFREFEWRLRTQAAASSLVKQSSAQWDGQTMRGTLLLVPECGYGDTIQMLRFAPLAAQRAGKLLVAAPPELAAIARIVPGVEQVICRPSETPEVQAHAFMLSLPHLLGARPDAIPGVGPYITPDVAQVQHWRRRLESLMPRAARRIGLVWAGRSDHQNDFNRSMSLADLAPLGQTPGASFFSLQCGPRATEAAAPPAGFQIVDLAPELGDFSDTACVLAALDLLITVDTSVAHLAGAIGVSAWVMLPFAPDWRWLVERPDTPWYPSVRLFRQRQRGQWSPVIERIRDELVIVK